MINNHSLFLGQGCCLLSSKFSFKRVASQLSLGRWFSPQIFTLCHLRFLLYMAHRFSKFRMLQLTCPFLDKNPCQGKESRKPHRTPSPPNWELLSKITSPMTNCSQAKGGFFFLRKHQNAPTCCRISSSIFTGEPSSATCLTPSLAYPPYSHRM